jgi:tetratricopeptide (TPR) repeat protein
LGMSLHQGKLSWRRVSVAASALALVFLISVSLLIFDPDPAVSHFLYFPSLGAAVLLAAGSLWIWERRFFNKIPADIKIFIVLALVIDCAVITFQQNMVWKDQFTASAFWAKHHPDSYWGHAGMGREYFRAQMYKEAVSAFEVAGRDPRGKQDLTIPSYLAMSYLKLGLDAQAKIIAEDLIRRYPSRWDGYFVLGLFYDQKNNYKKAMVCFEKATLFDGAEIGFFNLVKVSYKVGDMSGIDRVLTRAKGYWGEASTSFRRLRAFTAPLVSSRKVFFYRTHMLSLRPFSFKVMPQDIKFLYLNDGLMFP